MLLLPSGVGAALYSLQYLTPPVIEQENKLLLTEYIPHSLSLFPLASLCTFKLSESCPCFGALIISLLC